MSKTFKIAALFLMLTIVSVSKAQDNTTTDDSGNPPQKEKAFKIGLYVGAYFANKYTASAYDGYGYDIDGKRNSFAESYMNQKINFQYGGGYGYTDQIAQALNVPTGAWHFDESDMPSNMHYTPAFLLGLQGRYSVDKKNAISLNMNASKLNIAGNFTIVTDPPSGSTQINQSIQTFGITGAEQRLMFQIGYCRLFGDMDSKVNFFMEAGINITYTQFNKNQILINNLLINLTDNYYLPGVVQTNYTKLPRGTGLGAYAGMGLNLAMSPKWTVQLIYSPMYEGIKIVDNSKLKWQQSVGMRAYYNF